MKATTKKMIRVLDVLEPFSSNDEMHDIIENLVHSMGRRFRSRDPGRGTPDMPIRPNDRARQICGNDPADEGGETFVPHIKTFVASCVCALALLMALPAFGGVLLSTNTPVGVGEILSQVEAATLPTREFSVAIHQTVTKTNELASAMTSAGQLGTVQKIEERDFVAVCSTSGELRVVKAAGKNQIIQTATNTASNAPAILLTFNPVNALRHLATLNSTTVSDDVYQGGSCFKVVGEDKGFGFVLYVNKSDSTIRRQIIAKANELLFDSTFSYTNWSGFHAPLRTTTTKQATGVQSIQDFSHHTF
jgi:hypothetical protein